MEDQVGKEITMRINNHGLDIRQIRADFSMLRTEINGKQLV